MEEKQVKRGRNGKDGKWGLGYSEEGEKRWEKSKREYRRERVEGIFYGIVRNGERKSSKRREKRKRRWE